MTQSFRSFAAEVANDIYNQKLPATAEEFLDLLEPISENILTYFPVLKIAAVWMMFLLFFQSSLNRRSVTLK